MRVRVRKHASNGRGDRHPGWSLRQIRIKVNKANLACSKYILGHCGNSRGRSKPQSETSILDTFAESFYACQFISSADCPTMPIKSVSEALEIGKLQFSSITS